MGTRGYQSHFLGFLSRGKLGFIIGIRDYQSHFLGVLSIGKLYYRSPNKTLF